MVLCSSYKRKVKQCFCWPQYISSDFKSQWHPAPVLLPGKSHGWRSLEGCSPWGSLRVRHDWVTSLSLFTFMYCRRKWRPTPVFSPGESQGPSMGSPRVGHDWSDLAAKVIAVSLSILWWPRRQIRCHIHPCIASISPEKSAYDRYPITSEFTS